jgi:hypothetical protein
MEQQQQVHQVHATHVHCATYAAALQEFLFMMLASKKRDGTVSINRKEMKELISLMCAIRPLTS